MTPVDWLPWLRILALALVASGLVKVWRGAAGGGERPPVRMLLSAVGLGLLLALLAPFGPKLFFALGGWASGALALGLVMLLPVASARGGLHAAALLSTLPVAVLAPWAGRPDIESGYAFAAAVVPAASAAAMVPTAVLGRLAIGLAATGAAAHVLGRFTADGLGWAWVMLTVAAAVWLDDRLPARGAAISRPVALAALTAPVGLWLLEMPPAACWAPVVGTLSAGALGLAGEGQAAALRVARLVLAGGVMLLLVRLGGAAALATGVAAMVATGIEGACLLVAGAWWTRLMVQEHLDRSWLGREGVDLTHPYALAGLLAGMAALAVPGASGIGEAPSDIRRLMRPVAAWLAIVAVGSVLGLEAAGAALMGLLAMALLLGSGIGAPSGPRDVGLLTGLVAVATLAGPAMVTLGGLERPWRLALASVAIMLAAWSWHQAAEPADAAV